VSNKDDVFLKVFIGVLLGLSVFTVAIIILANSVGVLKLEGVSGNPMSEQAVNERISPIGKVKVAPEASAEPSGTETAASAPAERSGKEIVQATCGACHGTGVAGAPKIGDKDAWAPRADQGMATLLDHSMNGYKGMPARGGNPNLSDDEMKNAVAYLLEEAGVSAVEGGKTAAAAAPASKGAAAAPGANSAAAEGEKVFTTACAACHATGAAGAPRVGDKAAWADRIAQGMDTLKQHALKGFRAMPAKGGRMDLSDAAVVAAMGYMVEQSQ
jgi:cytochrome c5